MPAATLEDVARSLALARTTRDRLDTISFFALVFLAVTWAVQRLWNALRRDFPRLPRLSYGRAMSLVSLWGLLFLLVLTMISGARELLTPGAWQKQGLTYRLRPEEPPAARLTPDTGISPERYEALRWLRGALWAYSMLHDDQFPPDRSAEGVDPGAWLGPESSGVPYIYIPGRVADRGNQPVAYEPGVYGRERLVLFANGDIRALTIEDIRSRLDSEAR